MGPCLVFSPQPFLEIVQIVKFTKWENIIWHYLEIDYFAISGYYLINNNTTSFYCTLIFYLMLKIVIMTKQNIQEHWQVTVRKSPAVCLTVYFPKTKRAFYSIFSNNYI